MSTPLVELPRRLIDELDDERARYDDPATEPQMWKLVPRDELVRERPRDPEQSRCLGYGARERRSCYRRAAHHAVHACAEDSTTGSNLITYYQGRDHPGPLLSDKRDYARDVSDATISKETHFSGPQAGLRRE